MKEFLTQDELQADLNGKVAVAIRTARAAAGFNQQEFADLMGVEMLEMKAPAQFLLGAVYLFKTCGIELDMHDYDNLIIKVSNQAINNAVSYLEDASNRRSDKKVTA